MIDASNLLAHIKQHDKLNIRVSSNETEPPPEYVYQCLLKPHRKTNYFFLFITKGKSNQSVDLNKIVVGKDQLAFVLPHQIHLLPKKKENTRYYKLSIDQACLSLLPKSFLFLVNPFANPLITFDKKTSERVTIIFELLLQLLKHRDSDVDLILANLNTLLTEFNASYFSHSKTDRKSRSDVDKFIAFKLIAEKELTEQPSMEAIAKALGITGNMLYTIVKKYSGVSPKEFMTNRLILEAQRRLYYAPSTVKTLAYDLGFSDPDYFSKLFKKHTGKSITQFTDVLQDLSGL